MTDLKGLTPRPPRVLYWTELFWPEIGGAEVLSAALVPALRERGWELAVVTSHGHGQAGFPDEDAFRGVPVHRVPFWQALAGGEMDRMRAARRRVAALKRAFAPDLVHTTTAGPGLFFHLATRSTHPAPVLATVHAPLSGVAAEAALVGSTLREATWVTCVSSALLADVRRLAPDVASRSSVLYNGLAVPALPPAPLPFAPPRLLCAGRLVPEKGFDVALAATRRLVDRHPDLRLAIAGDGAAKGDLERDAARLEMGDRTEFLGWVSPVAMPALMNAATVVVMPSRWEEPFGLVALEAALMARPVVASRVGGLPEVVEHGATGLLVAPDDPEALAEALGTLLAHPEAAARMGAAGRARAREKFSLDRCVDGYDRLYRHVMQEGKRRC